MERMNTPRTRAEFERRFHLLFQSIKDGKYHVTQGASHSLDGLARLRFLPNGRLDFLSVDEMARLQANMMVQFNEESFQEQLKENQGPSDVEEAENDSPHAPVGSDGPSDSLG